MRTPDGRVVASNEEEVVGLAAAPSAEMAAAFAGRPRAALIEEHGLVEAAAAPAGTASVVREYLPILDRDERAIAVVAMWRDASGLLATLDAARTDVMRVTLVAGLLLAAILFLIFRSAQARLSRQHDQLIDATRRDALTEMLNHGAVVGLLTEQVESARASGESIGVALVDIDNFRLFNDTHGHEAGDEVLLRVADVVTREAGERGHVARYGPD